MKEAKLLLLEFLTPVPENNRGTKSKAS